MNARKLWMTRPAIWMATVLLASCSLPGVGQRLLAPDLTPVPPTPTVSPLPTISTAPPVASPVAGTLTVGRESAPPTPVPTLVLGPAIAHFSAGQKIDITYIHMTDDKRGWGIGGLSQAGDHVFRTQDGGQTWRDVTPPQPTPNTGEQVQAAGYFKDESTGWVVFSPAGTGSVPPYVLIWYTHDGGVSWLYSSLDTSSYSESFFASDMVFVDDQHGWFLAHLGAGMMHDYVAVIATSDGGVSWHVLLDPYNDGGIQSCTKPGMDFIDAQTGWLTVDCHGVASYAYLFRTSDGGATWQEIDLAPPAGSPDLFNNNACGLQTMALFSPLAGVFGMKCLDNATFKIEKDYLYWTSDGGKTWETASYPGGDLLFFDPKKGLALSTSIYTTTDGGHTWSKTSQVVWEGQFSFLDPNHGWAVARNQGAVALVSSARGGVIWDGKWDIIRPVVAP